MLGLPIFLGLDIMNRESDKISSLPFTDKAIRAFKPREKEYSKTDARSGLSLRIFPNGRKSFQYRYKLPGWKYYKRKVYGDYPDLSLKEARNLHHEAKQKVQDGIDLNVETKTRIQEQIAKPRVKESYEEYYSNYLLKELKRPERQVYYFKKDILPAIGEMVTEDVTRRHLIALLDKIVKRGAPVNANRTLSAIKRFFGFCVERGIIDDNPALQISKKSVGGSEKPKMRFLTTREIKKFWELMDSAPFSRQVQLILKILLLTGQRVGELCNAEWSEIDFKNGVWTIPEEKSKNGELNRVPLTYETQIYLSELSVLSGQSRFVCQSPQIKEEKPILYTTVNRAVLRHQNHFEIEKWTPHDLRRTVSTQMNEMGILPHVVEKILNHKMQGVMAVYNKAEHYDQKVEALARWEKRIKQILETDDDDLE